MSWIDFDSGASASSDWHDVAAFAWGENGKLSPASRTLIGRARQIASQLGCYLKVSCDFEAKEAFALGADRLHVGPLDAFVDREKPEILLFDGSRLVPAARLADRLRTGLGVCFDAELDVNARLLVMKTRAYGGRLIREWTCPTARPQIAVLETAGLPEPAEERGRTGEVVRG